MQMYQVDAFTDNLFAGNPAAILVLEDWLPDDIMLAIAQENNLAETAFVKPIRDGEWDLRWFTPAMEVDFCGHATLATAHILFTKHVACQISQRGGRLDCELTEERVFLTGNAMTFMEATIFLSTLI